MVLQQLTIFTVYMFQLDVNQGGEYNSNGTTTVQSFSLPVSFSTDTSSALAVRRTNTSGSTTNYVRLVRVTNRTSISITCNDSKVDSFGWVTIGV